MDYTFTLRYQLSEPDSNLDELVERLADAGCGDATVGVGKPGYIALEFVRQANSAEAAQNSARADLKLAMPGAKLISADCRLTNPG